MSHQIGSAPGQDFVGSALLGNTWRDHYIQLWPVLWGSTRIAALATYTLFAFVIHNDLERIRPAATLRPACDPQWQALKPASVR
jgi:hypothetical protein